MHSWVFPSLSVLLIQLVFHSTFIMCHLCVRHWAKSWEYRDHLDTHLPHRTSLQGRRWEYTQVILLQWSESYKGETWQGTQESRAWWTGRQAVWGVQEGSREDAQDEGGWESQSLGLAADGSRGSTASDLFRTDDVSSLCASFLPNLLVLASGWHLNQGEDQSSWVQPPDPLPFFLLFLPFFPLSATFKWAWESRSVNLCLCASESTVQLL